MKKIYNYLITFLLVAGVYLPTSSNGVISRNLDKLNCYILLPILLALYFKNKKIDKTQIYLVLGIGLSIGLATLTTPLSSLKYGNSFFYLLLCLVLCLDLRNIELSKWVQRSFIVINVINSIICFGIVFQSQMIQVFIQQNYSDFYDDLLTFMFYYRKPVLTFGSHSVAGFFLYLFFYLNLQSYKIKRKNLYLLFSLIYIYFLICLKSNTSFLFMGIGVIQLVSYFFKNKKITLYISIMMGIVLYFVFNNSVNQYVNSVISSVVNSATSQTNGLLGRYTISGNLSGNFDYISEHPFRPIGFGYSSELFYGDSGVVEYILRGTVILAFCIYFGLFRFLRRNLASRKTAYTLFGLIFLFEIGFSGLTYFRTLYLLPFVVIYLNTLEKQKGQELSNNKSKKTRKKIKWAA